MTAACILFFSSPFASCVIILWLLDSKAYEHICLNLISDSALNYYGCSWIFKECHCLNDFSLLGSEYKLLFMISIMQDFTTNSSATLLLCGIMKCKASYSCI